MYGHTQPHLTKRIVEKERNRKSNKVLEVRRWITRGDWWPERSKLKPRTSENETRPMKKSIYLEYTHKCSQLVDSKLYSRQESEKQAENKEKYFSIFRSIKNDIASIKQKPWVPKQYVFLSQSMPPSSTQFPKPESRQWSFILPFSLSLIQ